MMRTTYLLSSPAGSTDAIRILLLIYLTALDAENAKKTHGPRLAGGHFTPGKPGAMCS
jgi:hypothetical protein